MKAERLTIRLVIVLVFLASVASAQKNITRHTPLSDDIKPVIMKIGNRKQLLMDNYIVADIWNLERHLNKPKKYPGNPVIKFDREWEDYNIPGKRSGGPAASTIFYDNEDKIFKQWYSVFRVLNHQKPYLYTYWTCYATSKDGVHWEKPKLGVVEFNGSKDNNIVYKGRFWASGRVVKDKREKDPRKRYKFFHSDVYGIPPQKDIRAEDEGKTWTIREMIDNWVDATCLAFSPDGIHWTPYEGNPVEVVGLADGQGDALWDARLKKFISSRRPFVKAGASIRRIAISYSDDLIHWTYPETVIIPDELDTKELYDLTIFPYENIYFGCLSMFDSDKKQNIVQQLVFSRDLKQWDRLPTRDVFIGLGERTDFDAGMVSPARPIVVGDQIYIYYTGVNKAHNNWVVERGIGLLTLKLDRFIGRRTIRGKTAKHLTETAIDRNGEVMNNTDATEEGMLLTRPFICEGNSLQINCACPEGTLKVEVLNTVGKIYKGFEKDACVAFTGDALQHEIKWNNKKNLSRLKGKDIRLRFYLQNAELYSFQIF